MAAGAPIPVHLKLSLTNATECSAWAKVDKPSAAATVTTGGQPDITLHSRAAAAGETPDRRAAPGGDASARARAQRMGARGRGARRPRSNPVLATAQRRPGLWAGQAPVRRLCAGIANTVQPTHHHLHQIDNPSPHMLLKARRRAAALSPTHAERAQPRRAGTGTLSSPSHGGPRNARQSTPVCCAACARAGRARAGALRRSFRYLSQWIEAVRSHALWNSDRRRPNQSVCPR